jgi:predicted ABC-type ATPase
MPRVVVIAGPNGAGKSTLAAEIVGKVFGIAEFVNADTIAQGLSGFSPAAVALQAGRIMLDRLDALGAAGRDFAFETTLASRSFAPRLKAWQAQGYEFQLVFLWLSDAGLAEARVCQRVTRGGHDIPADVVRRRYARGLMNLFNLYLPIADGWRVLDNSGPGKAAPVAVRHPHHPIEVLETGIWQRLQAQYMTAEPRSGRPPHVAEPRRLDPLSEQILAAANRAVRAALREHKLLGFPISVWQDGRVVTIPPEDIRIEADSGDEVASHATSRLRENPGAPPADPPHGPQTGRSPRAGSRS